MSQPLHYRPLDCERVGALRRLWPLARQEMLVLFKTRMGVGLYFFCLLPWLGRLLMLSMMLGVIDLGPANGITDQMPDHLNPERAAFYIETALSTVPGMIFFFLLTSVVVSRCIARDRATNALELYWTRGISPWGYVFAKWLGGFLITASLSVGMPLMLWLTAIFLAEDWSLMTGTFWQFGAGLLGLLLMTAIWTAVGTLISAIASSANLAMVLWAMLFVGSSAVGSVISIVLDEPSLKSCLSFWEAGSVVVRSLADMAERDSSLTGALSMLALVFVGMLLVARQRMRVVEAVQ